MLLTPWSQLLHQSWNQLRRRFGRRPAPRPGYRSRSSSVDVLEDRVLLSQLGARWTSTATNGGGLNQGDPTTLTWSIIPDGTPISRAGDIAEEKNSNSDLIKYLDKEVGAGPGGADLTLRPWFSLFFDSFNRLSEVSPISMNQTMIEWLSALPIVMVCLANAATSGSAVILLMERTITPSICSIGFRQKEYWHTTTTRTAVTGRVR